jgi:putative radical SAM-modified peptide
MEYEESDVIVLDEGIEESAENMSACCSSGIKRAAVA